MPLTVTLVSVPRLVMLGCAAVVSVAASAPLTVRLASVPTLVMFGCAAVVSVPVSDVKRPLAARTSSAPPGSAPATRDAAVQAPTIAALAAVTTLLNAALVPVSGAPNAAPAVNVCDAV